MPVFDYRAKGLDNVVVRGRAAARDERELYRALQTDGKVLLTAREIREAGSRYRLKPRELSDFCRQIADMLGSGIMVARALDIMQQREPRAGVREVFRQLSDDLQRGMPLSAAMKSQPRAFPELLVNMFIAGEESGNLDRTAAKMAVHYDKEFKLNGKIRGAMLYPVLLLFLTVAVVLIVFTFVLPRFFALFEGQELPLVTRIVLAASSFTVDYWYVVLLALVLLVLGGRALLAAPPVRRSFDRLKLHLPGIGRMLRIIYTARFARTLSSMYASGLPMIESLTIAAGTIGNRHIEAQFDRVIADVRNGRMLSDALAPVDGFDPKLQSVVFVGEESGRLYAMLESVADTFDYEADAAATRLVSVLGPLCIIVMALIIGTIIVSVMLPIMSMYENMNNQTGMV